MLEQKQKRWLIMQGNFPKMESLPARESFDEAQAEMERLNKIYDQPRETWDGSNREKCWLKEIC